MELLFSHLIYVVSHICTLLDIYLCCFTHFYIAGYFVILDVDNCESEVPMGNKIAEINID